MDEKKEEVVKDEGLRIKMKDLGRVMKCREKKGNGKRAGNCYSK